MDKTDKDKKANLQTVARKAGVSVATASQALRNAGRISQPTRNRVMRAARDLNYIRDGRAASMRSGKNHEIGLVIQSIANPFNAEVISGVSDCLEQEGYFVSVLDSQNNAEKETRNLEAFIAGARGGLIWVPSANPQRESMTLLSTHRIPSVTFLRTFPGSPFDHVGIENSKATFEGTRYLRSLGHEHIAYFGGTGDSQVRAERISGYRQALGLGDSTATPVIWDCIDTRLDGLNAATELMDAHPEITALVCNGDMVALGACLAITRKGMQPGREISVIGFDDIPDAALTTPRLTTMAVSPVQLGQRLARTLIDRIRNPSTKRISISVDAELIERETTAPPV